MAATVIEVDAKKSIVLITDLANSNRVQAHTSPDSTVRRFSAPIAQTLAMRMQDGRSSAAPPSSLEGDRSRASSPSSPGRESGQQPGWRDLQSVIESLPPLSLVDLKPGEVIILSCTNGGDPSRVTAITLLAGVEPLLRTSSKGARTLDLGSWNLDLNMNVGLP